jgi:outer membrane protein assembly factor BamB
VTASAAFVDKQTGKTIWSNNTISGDSTYFLSGPSAASEDDAVAAALTDLVRHIVEDVLESW